MTPDHWLYKILRDWHPLATDEDDLRKLAEAILAALPVNAITDAVSETVNYQFKRGGSVSSISRNAVQAVLGVLS